MDLRSLSEPLRIFERTEVMIKIIGPIEVCRSDAEQAPKLLSQEKILFSLARRAVGKAERVNRIFASLTLPYDGSPGFSMSLADLAPVSRFPGSTQGFFDLISGFYGRIAVVALGAAEPHDAKGTEQFAQTLLKIDADREARFFKKRVESILSELGESSWLEGEPLIIEEKPGKAKIFDPTSEVMKRGRKTRQNFFASEKRLESWSSRPGWAASHIVIEKVDEAGLGVLRFKTSEILVKDSEFSFESAQVISNYVRDLMSRCGVSPKTVVIATASAGVAEVLAERVSEFLRAEFKFPDLVFGWHPFASYLQLLAHSEMPSLFINLGRFPTVTFNLVWDT